MENQQEKQNTTLETLAQMIDVANQHQQELVGNKEFVSTILLADLIEFLQVSQPLFVYRMYMRIPHNSSTIQPWLIDLLVQVGEVRVTALFRFAEDKEFRSEIYEKVKKEKLIEVGVLDHIYTCFRYNPFTPLEVSDLMMAYQEWTIYTNVSNAFDPKIMAQAYKFAAETPAKVITEASYRASNLQALSLGNEDVQKQTMPMVIMSDGNYGVHKSVKVLPENSRLDHLFLFANDKSYRCAFIEQISESDRHGLTSSFEPPSYEVVARSVLTLASYLQFEENFKRAQEVRVTDIPFLHCIFHATRAGHITAAQR